MQFWYYAISASNTILKTFEHGYKILFLTTPENDFFSKQSLSIEKYIIFRRCYSWNAKVQDAEVLQRPNLSLT